MIYARAETPLATLAIGLPFAIVIWTYLCFGQQMSASKGIMATPPMLGVKDRAPALL